MKFHLILFIFLASCSSIKKYFNQNDDYKSAGITINTDLDEGAYGPLPQGPNQEVEIKIKNRDPVVAYVFGPGLYRTSAYVGLLKKLELNKTPIHMLVGSEFGALVAALYAKYKKASLVEWHMFNLVQKVDKESIPFKRSWKGAIHELIEKEFKGKRIERLKLPIILPLYSSKLDKVIYTTKGDAVTILKAQFEISTKAKLRFIPPPSRVLFSESAIRDSGADLIYTFNVLGGELRFKRDDGFVWGIYSGMAQRIDSEFYQFDNTFNLVEDDTVLDDPEKFPKLVSNALEISDEISQKILDHISEWKSENND
jgi:hypothetical protein